MTGYWEQKENSLNRMETYLSNMEIYTDNTIVVRFLDKIYQLMMEASEKECKDCIDRFKIFVDKNQNIDRKCLCSLYLYKISEMIHYNSNINTMIKSPILLQIDVEYRPMPDKVREMYKLHGRNVPLVFAESSKPDEEAIEKFNIYISEDHFYASRKKGDVWI